VPRTVKKSGSYKGIGTDSSGEKAVPILESGIGTRISAAADAIGSRKKAAEVGRVSTDSLQRYIRDENMPPFDVAARLCSAAGIRMEWLATGQGSKFAKDETHVAVSQPLRREDLILALQLAAETLGDRQLEPPKHAELVVLIYELLEEGLPEAKVRRFARAASN